MPSYKSKLLVVAASLVSMLGVVGCTNDADIASHNLSLAADNFQIERRIVFINTWTNSYLLSITGLCSIKNGKENTGNKSVAVTCKVGPGEYKKHYLGLNGNVSYFSEQIEPAAAGTYYYKVVFKPTSIIPDIERR